MGEEEGDECQKASEDQVFRLHCGRGRGSYRCRRMRRGGRFVAGDGARSVRRAIRLTIEDRSLCRDGVTERAAGPFSNYSESLLRPAAAACREHLSLMSEATKYLRKAADFHPP